MEYKTCLRNVSSEDYTKICNKLCLDPNVSLKAKGVFLMMVSLSTIPDWEFSVEKLIPLIIEGETAVRSAIKELKGAGYLKMIREQEQGKITKFIYKLNNSNGDGFSSKHFLDEMEKQSGTRTNLYLMQNKETRDLKIGVSIDPDRRKIELQNSSGREIEILCIVPGKGYLESLLHEKFSHLRLMGEWFKFDELILEEFKKLTS